MIKKFVSPSGGYWIDARKIKFQLTVSNKIEPTGKYTYQVFNPSYLLFDDIDEFKNAIQFILTQNCGVLNPSINTKVYIHKSSFIPSILFSKILKNYNITEIKRCVKENDANLISINVKNTLTILNKYEGSDYSNLTYALFAIKPGDELSVDNIAHSDYISIDTLITSSDRLDSMKSRVSDIKSRGYDVYFALPCFSEKIDEIYNLISNPGKYIDDYNLVKYLWSKMTKLPEDAVPTFCAELKSDDQGAVSSAIDSICMFNWGDCMFDVYKAIAQNNYILTSKRQSDFNKNEEFFFACINSSIKKLRRFHNVYADRWVSLPYLLKSNSHITVFDSPLYVPISEDKLRMEISDALSYEITNSYSLGRKIRNMSLAVATYLKETSPDQTTFGLDFFDAAIKDIRQAIYEKYKDIIKDYNLEVILEKSIYSNDEE